MQKLQVKADNGTYDICIGEGVLSQWEPDKDYAVITDRNIYEKHKDKFPKEAYAAILEPGEQTKNLSDVEKILDALAERGVDRSAALVAFGGGVVGDITGLAAALYKRGIRFIQVPTTLLAQVDSSVGGKVGVNLLSGKNLAGVFLQPEVVLIDTRMLETLPPREFAAGMAEVIKYAFIASAPLYEKLMERSVPMEDMIAECCAVKARYVEQDPYDTGVRMQLNYGHTLGHAIESAAGYGQYLHGEAVAIGMVYAARIGEMLGISPAGLTEKTQALVQMYDLPSEVPADLLKAALEYLGNDKKVVDGKIQFVLIDEIGHAKTVGLTTSEIAQMLGVNA